MLRTLAFALAAAALAGCFVRVDLWRDVAPRDAADAPDAAEPADASTDVPLVTDAPVAPDAPDPTPRTAAEMLGLGVTHGIAARAGDVTSGEYTVYYVTSAASPAERRFAARVQHGTRMQCQRDWGPLTHPSRPAGTVYIVGRPTTAGTEVVVPVWNEAIGKVELWARAHEPPPGADPATRCDPTGAGWTILPAPPAPHAIESAASGTSFVEGGVETRYLAARDGNGGAYDTLLIYRRRVGDAAGWQVWDRPGMPALDANEFVVSQPTIAAYQTGIQFWMFSRRPDGAHDLRHTWLTHASARWNNRWQGPRADELREPPVTAPVVWTGLWREQAAMHLAYAGTSGRVFTWRYSLLLDEWTPWLEVLGAMNRFHTTPAFTPRGGAQRSDALSLLETRDAPRRLVAADSDRGSWPGTPWYELPEPLL